MGRTAAVATALLMVVLTASAGVASPVAGANPAAPGTEPATGSPLAGEDASTTPTPTITDLEPEPVENTTARLVIPEDQFERAGIAAVQPDLGAALGDVGEDVHRRHNQLVTDVRFVAAGDSDERETVIDQTLIDLKDDAVALREHQHVAISRYANGTIDETELLRTLARIDRSARRMLETTSYLKGEVDRIGLRNRIYEVEAILETLKGPVRQEVRRTLNADGETSHFYVQATATALVLSTVDNDGRYLREAYVPSNRGEGPSRVIEGPVHAQEISAEYYPWAWDNFVGTIGAIKLDDVYRTTRPHVQGETVAYLDAYSGNVFYEIHRLDVDSMPTSVAHEETKDGFEIVVQRTYPGGPMIVGVYDAETGNHVNARVSVAGVEVGSTDADSLVRAVEPRTEYEISVRTPLASTNVTVDPQAED